MCEICSNCTRNGERKVGEKMIPTNHHPNCPHYNDSLIDVWKIIEEGAGFYTDNLEDTFEYIEDGATIIKERMHKEIYDNLYEFKGF